MRLLLCARHKISAFVQIAPPRKKRKAGVPGKKWQAGWLRLIVDVEWEEMFFSVFDMPRHVGVLFRRYEKTQLCKGGT